MESQEMAKGMLVNTARDLAASSDVRQRWSAFNRRVARPMENRQRRHDLRIGLGGAYESTVSLAGKRLAQKPLRMGASNLSVLFIRNSLVALPTKNSFWAIISHSRVSRRLTNRANWPTLPSTSSPTTPCGGTCENCQLRGIWLSRDTHPKSSTSFRTFRDPGPRVPLFFACP